MEWYVHNCQPPPPTWTPEEEETIGSSQPPPPKRSCSDVEKEDVDTLPSWRDEFDDIDWGTEDEADKNALRRKPDADASRLSTPGSPDVLPPKKESETEATHEADPPHRATNADVKPVLKERKSKQAGWACPGCGSTKRLGMTKCTVCHRALKREAVEDRQRNLDIVLKAVKCVRKWIDRGVRSSGADMRLDYKRRIRRAERLGFTSVVDRFINDGLFRVQMIELGWNQHNIADVDTIGNRQAMENTGRSYHQRWKYEGWYDRHE